VEAMIQGLFLVATFSKEKIPTLGS